MPINTAIPLPPLNLSHTENMTQKIVNAHGIKFDYYNFQQEGVEETL